VYRLGIESPAVNEALASAIAEVAVLSDVTTVPPLGGAEQVRISATVAQAKIMGDFTEPPPDSD
jgi:hypothetical protein